MAASLLVPLSLLIGSSQLSYSFLLVSGGNLGSWKTASLTTTHSFSGFITFRSPFFFFLLKVSSFFFLPDQVTFMCPDRVLVTLKSSK